MWKVLRKETRKEAKTQSQFGNGRYTYVYIYMESGSIPVPPSVPRSTKKTTRSEPQLSTMCQQIKSKRAQRPSVDKDVKSVEKETSARQQIKRSRGNLPKWNQKGTKNNKTGAKRKPK